MHCVHCFKEFKPNPRVKNQKYCGDKLCQKARRARWRRHKMATDTDYQENQKRCQNEWQKRNAGYWKNYRSEHPGYARRNNTLQQIRNARRRKDKQSKMIAKIDSLIKPYYSRKGAIFKLIPQNNSLIAKIDSLRVRLVPVQAGRYRI